MRELSLHILDLLENSLRAGATQVNVALELDKEEEWLSLSVEDNGKGLPGTPEQALDPFYTTKTGKRTGLGLSLFKAAAEQAAGTFQLGQSPSGGVAARATFQYHNLDRAPLGTMADTFLVLLLSNPDLHLVFSCVGPQGAFSVESRTENIENKEASPFALAKIFAKLVKDALLAAGISD